jgi:transcriptional regulator with XRE-family HTH domain
MAEPPTVKVNGAAIRKIRMSAGREMRDLAAEAGITRSYLNRLEVGSRLRMRPSTYRALSEALAATEDQLLASGEDQEP